MKNSKFIIVGILFNLSVFFTSFIVAQTPEKMSYQAIVRNSTNDLVINQVVGMQISVLQGSVGGTAVYVETQTPTTNTNGLVSLEIGGGTVVSGSMASIDWANGPYFVKTETDLLGGSDYTITGTFQFLSVPYALYAKTSGSSTPGPQGIQGDPGIQGVQGQAGENGQGVPTGGTAGQVLSKIDGTDFNTEWVTTSGGSSLPTQTGNAGKVLTTDGTNTSWAGSTGATLALQATKTSGSQVLSLANGTNQGDLVIYNNTTTTVPAIGTYDDNGVFTVVQSGLYFVQAVTRSLDQSPATSTINQNLYVSIDNGDALALNSFHTIYSAANNANYPAGVKGKGYTSGMYFLTTGQTIRIKGLSSNSSTAGTALKTDGSCQLMIVKF